MLTPEELLAIADTMYPHVDKLNEWIIKKCIAKINERIARGEDFTLSETDKWQLGIYRDAGGIFEDVEAEMIEFTQTAQEEIRAIFEDAGIRAWTADENFYKVKGRGNSTPMLKNKRMMDILTDSYKRTNGEVRNFTRTTAEATQDRFIKTLDEAHMKVVTGASSYSQAYTEAIKDICGYQAEVVYPSGHTDTVETAVFRAIRTGTAQASGNMTLEGMIEHDWDLIRVSAHLGARYGDGGENPGNHFWWQGKLYSRSGKDPKYPDFVKTTGYGTGAGLGGWNCRHSFGPGDPDHNPFKDYDAEENRLAYDLSQKQRAAERRIRHQKSKVLGLKNALDNAPDESAKEALELAYQKESYKLANYNAEYNKFCSDFGLKKLSERITIAKWNRSEAAKAVQASKRLKEYNNRAIIIKKEIQHDILSGKYPLNVNVGNQNKHITTSHSYNSELHKSIFWGTLADASKLVQEYHGTGDIKLTRKQKWTSKEIVVLDRDIGSWFDGEKYISTNCFAIHYGKKGTHVVPMKRRRKYGPSTV